MSEKLPGVITKLSSAENNSTGQAEQLSRRNFLHRTGKTAIYVAIMASPVGKATAQALESLNSFAEKTPNKEAKEEQAKVIVERLKQEYLASDLISGCYEKLIEEYKSVETAGFWFAIDKAKEIIAKVQEEQDIKPENRTDVLGGFISSATQHLLDISNDLERWAIKKLAPKIANDISSKFTPETVPWDKKKAEAIKLLKDMGVILTQSDAFASGDQLQEVYVALKILKNESPTLMKIASIELVGRTNQAGGKGAIFLGYEMFDPHEPLPQFLKYPDKQRVWITIHENGHLVYDALPPNEQKAWRDMQSAKDFQSMISKGYDGDHRFPEMFSYYFVDRQSMISSIQQESDPDAKSKLIKQFDFIAKMAKGKTFPRLEYKS
jgi:hypothetical protein